MPWTRRRRLLRMFRLRMHAVGAMLALATLVVGMNNGASMSSGLSRASTGGSALTADPVTTGAAAVAAARRRPWVGLLAPTPNQLAAAGRSGLDRVAVGRGWDALQSKPGPLNSAVVANLRRAIGTAVRQRVSATLDLGLQYPAKWAFALPGQTRFVNQYGDVWRGRLSQDVPNAVFNSAVRRAQGRYIAALGRALRSSPVSAVRVGGLLSGELRYPDAEYRGRRMSLWMYDSAAQAHAPHRGWRPGKGSRADARKALAYYYASLTRYQVWLMRTVARAFPRAEQQVMFPSWGLRPGFTERAVQAGLRGTTVAEVNGMISAGLDWAQQVRAMKRTRIPSVVYCTWVDAPAQGRTTAQIPPVAYLARLAQRSGMAVAGENTGRGGRVALDLTMKRAVAYRLVGVMYMSGLLISQRRAGITWQQFSKMTTKRH